MRVSRAKLVEKKLRVIISALSSLSIIALLFSLILFSIPSISSAPAYSNFLQVDGKKIIDETGNQVLLRGFNLRHKDIFNAGRREGLPLTISRFQQIKGWGFNTICTQAWWGKNIEPYEHRHGVYSERNLKKLERVVENAGGAGLYVIISIRVQHEVENPVEWDGWATHDYLLTTEGLTRYCAMLEMLVKRFDHYPQVVGYGVWHYPFHDQWGIPDSTYRQYYDVITPAMITAIRGNSTKIIFYSPMHHGVRFMSTKSPWMWDTGEYSYISPVNDPLDNVVYTHAGHRPFLIEFHDSEWDYNKNDLRTQLRYAKTFMDRYDVPMMMSEFGLFIHKTPEVKVRPIRQSRLDCLDAKLSILDEYGDYNWMYWIYSNDDMREGVLESDLSPSSIIPILQKHTLPQET